MSIPLSIASVIAFVLSSFLLFLYLLFNDSNANRFPLFIACPLCSSKLFVLSEYAMSFSFGVRCVKCVVAFFSIYEVVAGEF